jgi:hypothetical protein
MPLMPDGVSAPHYMGLTFDQFVESFVQAS